MLGRFDGGKSGGLDVKLGKLDKFGGISGGICGGFCVGKVAGGMLGGFSGWLL